MRLSQRTDQSRIGGRTGQTLAGGLVITALSPFFSQAEQPRLKGPSSELAEAEAGAEADAIPLRLMQAQPVPVQPPQVEAAAAEAAQRDARILGWVLERGLEALAAPVMDAPATILPNRQQRIQIEQQAQQMERFFQPALAGELEMIRQACGSLNPAARQKLLTTGQSAVKQAAKEYATRQLTGGLELANFDPREEVRRPLIKLLEELADPTERATYEREQATRAARRAEAARVMIITKVDRQLDLSSGQRQAIETDLALHWQADWRRPFTEHGGLVNGYPVAPDYAAGWIRPHLRPEQAAAWDAWCQAAGERLIGRQMGVNLDNQGIQVIDRWWGEAP